MPAKKRRQDRRSGYDSQIKWLYLGAGRTVSISRNPMLKSGFPLYDFPGAPLKSAPETYNGIRAKVKSKSAIIIDDNPVDLYYLDCVLTHRNYQVQSYLDPVLTPLFKSKGCPCLLKSSGCPDLIISDFNMPVVNGVELLESAMEKGCRCRHLALISAMGHMEESLRRLAKYGTRFFTKPLDLDDFYDWLDRVERESIGHQSA